MSQTKKLNPVHGPSKVYITPHNFDPNALEYSRVKMSTAPTYLPVCSVASHDSLLSRVERRSHDVQPDIPITDDDGRLLPFIVQTPADKLKVLTVPERPLTLQAPSIGSLLQQPSRAPPYRLPSSRLLSLMHAPATPPVGYARPSLHGDDSLHLRGTQAYDRWVSREEVDSWAQQQGSFGVSSHPASVVAGRPSAVCVRAEAGPARDACVDANTSTLNGVGSGADSPVPVAREGKAEESGRAGAARSRPARAPVPRPPHQAMGPATGTGTGTTAEAAAAATADTERPTTATAPAASAAVASTLPHLPETVPIALAAAYLQTRHRAQELPLASQSLSTATASATESSAQRPSTSATSPLPGLRDDPLTQLLAAQSGGGTRTRTLASGSASAQWGGWTNASASARACASDPPSNAFAREVAANALRMLARARRHQSAWEARDDAPSHASLDTPHGMPYGAPSSADGDVGESLQDAFDGHIDTERTRQASMAVGRASEPAHTHVRARMRADTSSSSSSSSAGGAASVLITAGLHTPHGSAHGVAPCVPSVLLPQVSAPPQLVHGWLARVAVKLLSSRARTRAVAAGSHKRSALDALGLSQRCLREARMPDALQHALHEALYAATAGALAAMRRLASHSARGAALLAAVYEAYIALLNAQEPALTRWVYACVHLHQLKRAHATLATCRAQLASARHTNARVYAQLTRRLRAVWAQTHALVLARAKLLVLRLRLAALRRVQEALQSPLAAAKAAAADWRTQARLASSDIETVTRLTVTARRQAGALQAVLVQCEREYAADAAVTAEARRVIRTGERARRTLQVACDAAAALLEGAREEEQEARREAGGLRALAEEEWRRRREWEGAAAREEVQALNAVSASVAWMRDPALASNMRAQPHRRRELLLAAVAESGEEGEAASARARAKREESEAMEAMEAMEEEQRERKEESGEGEGVAGEGVRDGEAEADASAALTVASGAGAKEEDVVVVVEVLLDADACVVLLLSVCDTAIVAAAAAAAAAREEDARAARAQFERALDGPPGFTLQRATEIIARKRDYLARAEADASEHVAVCHAETLTLSTEAAVLHAEAARVEDDTMAAITRLEDSLGALSALEQEALSLQGQLSRVVELRVAAEMSAADAESGALATTLRAADDVRAEIAYLTAEHAARTAYAATVRGEAAAVVRETHEQAAVRERAELELERIRREKGDAARRGVANATALREMVEGQLHQEQVAVRAREEAQRAVEREEREEVELRATAQALEEQVSVSNSFLLEVGAVRAERERALQEMDVLCRNREAELRSASATLTALQTQQLQRNDDHNRRRMALTARGEEAQRAAGATRLRVTMKRDELRGVSALLRSKNADYRARLASAQARVEARRQELLSTRMFVVNAHAAATHAYDALMGELAATLNGLSRAEEEHTLHAQAARAAYEERKQLRSVRRRLVARRARQQTELRLVTTLCALAQDSVSALGVETVRCEELDAELRQEAAQQLGYQSKLLLLAGQQQYAAAIATLFSRKHRAVQHVSALAATGTQTEEVVVSHRGTRTTLQTKVVSFDSMGAMGRRGSAEPAVAPAGARSPALRGSAPRKGERRRGGSGGAGVDASVGSDGGESLSALALDAGVGHGSATVAAVDVSTDTGAAYGSPAVVPDASFEPTMGSPPRALASANANANASASPASPASPAAPSQGDAVVAQWVRAEGMGAAVSVRVGTESRAGLLPLVVPACAVQTPAQVLQAVLCDTIATIITVPTLPAARASVAETVGSAAVAAEEMAMVRAAGQFQRVCTVSNNAVVSAAASKGVSLPALAPVEADAGGQWESDGPQDGIDAIIRYALQLRQRSVASAIPHGHVAVQVREPEPVARARVMAVGLLLSTSERYYYDFAHTRRAAMTVEDLYLYAMLAKETQALYGDSSGAQLAAALDYVMFKLDVLDHLARAATMPATVSPAVLPPTALDATSADPLALGVNTSVNVHAHTVAGQPLSPTMGGGSGVNADVLRRLLLRSRAADDDEEDEARRERERRLAELLDLYRPGPRGEAAPASLLARWVAENPALWARIQAESAARASEAAAHGDAEEDYEYLSEDGEDGGEDGDGRRRNGRRRVGVDGRLLDRASVARDAKGLGMASAADEAVPSAPHADSASTLSPRLSASATSLPHPQALSRTSSAFDLPLLPQPHPDLDVEASADALDVGPGAAGVSLAVDDASGEGGIGLATEDGEDAFQARHASRSAARADALARQMRMLDPSGAWQPAPVDAHSPQAFPSSPNALLYALLARDSAAPHAQHMRPRTQARASGGSATDAAGLLPDHGPPSPNSLSPRSRGPEHTSHGARRASTAAVLPDTSRFDGLFAELQERYKDRLKPSPDAALAALLTPRNAAADEYLLLQERLLPRHGNEALLAQVQASGQRLQRESAVVRTRTQSQRADATGNGTILPSGAAAFVGVGGPHAVYNGPGSRDASPLRTARSNSAHPTRASSSSPSRAGTEVPSHTSASTATPAITTVPLAEYRVASAPARDNTAAAGATSGSLAPRDVYAGRTTGQRVETAVLGGNVGFARAPGPSPPVGALASANTSAGRPDRGPPVELAPVRAHTAYAHGNGGGGASMRALDWPLPSPSSAPGARTQSAASAVGVRSTPSVTSRAPVAALPPLSVLTQPRGRADKRTTDAVKAAILRATGPKKRV